MRLAQTKTAGVLSEFLAIRVGWSIGRLASLFATMTALSAAGPTISAGFAIEKGWFVFARDVSIPAMVVFAALTVVMAGVRVWRERLGRV